MAENPNALTYKNVLAWRGCENLYLNNRTCDVYFVFKTENDEIEKVPAHKSMLSAISVVFDAMFYGPSKQDGDIKIVDTTVGVFKEFLQYFYLSTVKLTAENVAEVMNLGKQYMLNDCLDACTEFCKETLTLDNMCWGYELSILFEQDDLKQFCEQRISANPQEIFRSNSFLMCDKNLLRRILQLDTLTCEESVVFDGCLAWAKAACIQKGLDEKNGSNLRGQLGDLFYEIRFGQMSAEKFLNFHCSYEGLFSMDELKDLGAQQSNKSGKGSFVRGARLLERKHSGKDVLVCNRIHLNEPADLFSHRDYKRILSTFSSNCLLLLQKIHIVPPYRHNETHRWGKSYVPIIIKMAEKSTDRDNRAKEALYANITTFSALNQNVIEFTSPILIQPNVDYEIFIYVEDYFSYGDFSGILDCKQEVLLDDGIIIKFGRDNFITQLDFIRQ